MQKMSVLTPIVVGYWMRESLVSSSEHFPQGGLNYLAQVCDWAAQQGFYIIIDLHGAPYSQASSPNPDTGQYCNPSFYTASDAFERTYRTSIRRPGDTIDYALMM